MAIDCDALCGYQPELAYRPPRLSRRNDGDDVASMAWGVSEI